VNIAVGGQGAGSASIRQSPSYEAPDLVVGKQDQTPNRLGGWARFHHLLFVQSCKTKKDVPMRRQDKEVMSNGPGWPCARFGLTRKRCAAQLRSVKDDGMSASVSPQKKPQGGGHVTGDG